MMNIVACTSTTVIRSYPIGAKIYMDNKLVGKTPYEHTDRKWFLGKQRIRIEKKDYETISDTLYRSQEWDIGAILGILSLPWCRKYKSEQFYELKKQKLSQNEN